MQKFIKAITFGLIDPFEAGQKKKRAARKSARKKPLSVEPTGPRLYVGNLDYEVTDEDLDSTFGRIGTVTEALIVRQGRTGRSKGFGFVEMSSLEEAREAVRKLNDSDLKGRAMLVTGAKSDKPGKREEKEWKPSGEGSSPRSEKSRGGGRSGDRRESRSRGDRGGRSRGERSGEKESRTVKPREVAVVESAFVTIERLNAEATEEDVHDLFEEIGTICNRGEEISGGNLTVELASREEAQKAVSLLHGKSFMGGQLKVTEAAEEQRSGLRAPAAFEPTATESPEPPKGETSDSGETEPASSAEEADAPEPSVATSAGSPDPEDLPVKAEAPLDEISGGEEVASEETPIEGTSSEETSSEGTPEEASETKEPGTTEEPESTSEDGEEKTSAGSGS